MMLAPDRNVEPEGTVNATPGGVIDAPALGCAVPGADWGCAVPEEDAAMPGRDGVAPEGDASVPGRDGVAPEGDASVPGRDGAASGGDGKASGRGVEEMVRSTLLPD